MANPADNQTPDSQSQATPTTPIVSSIGAKPPRTPSNIPGADLASDAIDKLTQWANYTEKGREEHPLQAKVGEIANNLQGMLFGERDAMNPKPEGSKTGFLNNPVTSLIAGAPDDAALNLGRNIVTKGVGAVKDAVSSLENIKSAKTIKDDIQTGSKVLEGLRTRPVKEAETAVKTAEGTAKAAEKAAPEAAPSPQKMIEDQGLKYKGELMKGSRVHMFEHPEFPGHTAALHEDQISPEAIASKMDSKLNEFGDVPKAKQLEGLRTRPVTAPQGGHAGGGVTSVEELARPGRFVKVSRSGALTDQGKVPDFNLRPGEVGYQVKPDGSFEVRDGIESPAHKIAIKGYAKEVFPQKAAIQAAEGSTKLPEIKENYATDLSKYSKTLHHETNVNRALELIPTGGVHADQPTLYFANTPDLATGQAGKTGVRLEFDSKGIQGQVNLSKPMAKAAYDQGQAEFVSRLNDQKTLQNNLKSITVDKNAPVYGKGERVRMQASLKALEDRGWTKTATENGFKYTRPEAGTAPTAHQQVMKQNVSPEDDMNNPDTRYAASRHEAGHAVVSEMLNPGSVTSMELGDFGGKTKANAPDGKQNPKQLNRDELTNMVARSLAGGETESGGTTPFHSSGDVKNRSNLMAANAGGLINNASRLLSGKVSGKDSMLDANKVQAEAQARVNAILADPKNMRAVEGLATKLTDKGKLSGEEVRNILAGIK